MNSELSENISSVVLGFAEKMLQGNMEEYSLKQLLLFCRSVLKVSSSDLALKGPMSGCHSQDTLNITNKNL